MSRVVVLGWDALDAELIEQYGLTDAFGETQKIDTYANPVIDEPHTRELWPSMITGMHPDEHGIHAVSDEDGVEWDSDWLNILSSWAAGRVPQPVLNAIGRRLRERGAGLDAKRPRYYRRNGHRSVFDRTGRAISIPNYRTPYDEEHDLDGNRDDVWGAILPDRDGADGLEPSVGLPTVWETLGSAVGDRRGHTLAAMAEGHGLIWTWFGLLDTVGHIDPAMDADLERAAYELAAQVTASIRALAGEDTIVVSVSDHGLQNGDHTHYATLATDHPPAHASINHVFDVADWVRSARSRRATTDEGYNDGLDDVTEQLESLGYIEG